MRRYGMLPRDESLSLLRLLVEAGADEAVVETPVNCFEKSASPLEGEAGAKRRVGGIASIAPSPPTRSPSARDARADKSSTGAFVLPPSTLKGGGEQSSISNAREIALACQTLDELKHALENFTGCELKRLAKSTVFARGNPSARIMFIGEAPGRDEDEQGLPFVGRAGQLLDRMLAAANLDQTKVYITNVLNWRPPQNRDPTPEEAATCLPFLRRHIELVGPEILVLLGAVAVRHVLGLTEGIMRLRGNWQIYQSGTRAIPVMPTLHPAYLLRQPSSKRFAWRDMLAIIEKARALNIV